MLWIPVEPCFVSHIVKAYDLPDARLVLDIVPYDGKHEAKMGGDAATPEGFVHGRTKWEAGEPRTNPALNSRWHVVGCGRNKG